MRRDDRVTRRRRPARPALDPWAPPRVLDEVERRAGGTATAFRTVFLAGAECPFTCVFCDLWRHTLSGPTPAGALPHQLAAALADAPPEIRGVKLYNASNFFEPRAVPPADLPALAELTAPFERVVVECHPRLVDRRAAEFHALVGGRLELALGLETVHPEALPRLGKEMSLADFDRACGFARRHGIGLRAFVLVGAPFVPPAEQVEWVERSVRHAVDQGVAHVALIPVRSTTELEALAVRGRFAPPGLGLVEEALDRGLAAQTDACAVTLDTWDLELHAADACCAPARRERLRRMSASGAGLPPIECPECAR